MVGRSRPLLGNGNLNLCFGNGEASGYHTQMGQTGLHHNCCNFRPPLWMTCFLDNVQEHLVPAYLLNAEGPTQLQSDRVVRPHTNMFVLRLVGSRKPQLERIDIKIHLLHFNGEHHPHLVGRRAAGAGLLHDLADRRAADKVTGLEQIVGMPKILRRFWLETYRATAILGADILLGKLHLLGGSARWALRFSLVCCGHRSSLQVVQFMAWIVG